MYNVKIIHSYIYMNVKIKCRNTHKHHTNIRYTTYYLLCKTFTQNLKGRERGIRLTGHGVTISRGFAGDDAFFVEYLAAHLEFRACSGVCKWFVCLRVCFFKSVSLWMTSLSIQ